jgi:hypothetical protein
LVVSGSYITNLVATEDTDSGVNASSRAGVTVQLGFASASTDSVGIPEQSGEQGVMVIEPLQDAPPAVTLKV